VVADEDRAIVGLGAFLLQVSREGRAGGRWQRQDVFTAALGVAQRNRASAPVDDRT
jgi:hypothetical protein